jgi:hypothetical protein
MLRRLAPQSPPVQQEHRPRIAGHTSHHRRDPPVACAAHFSKAAESPDHIDVLAPIGPARPAAPIAGLRGTRTSVIGLGPAAATASLVDPRTRREGDLPRPTSLPAAHQVSPPLACLPGSDQPSKQAGTATPEPHRVLPYSRRSLLAVLIRGSRLKAPSQPSLDGGSPVRTCRPISRDGGPVPRYQRRSVDSDTWSSTRHHAGSTGPRNPSLAAAERHGPDEAGAVSNPGPAAAGSLVRCWPGSGWARWRGCVPRSG